MNSLSTWTLTWSLPTLNLISVKPVEGRAFICQQENAHDVWCALFLSFKSSPSSISCERHVRLWGRTYQHMSSLPFHMHTIVLQTLNPSHCFSPWSFISFCPMTSVLLHHVMFIMTQTDQSESCIRATWLTLTNQRVPGMLRVLNYPTIESSHVVLYAMLHRQNTNSISIKTT